MSDRLDLEKIYQAFLSCSSVSSDTRTIQEDSLFVALKGPNFNANSLAKEAIAKGAKYALVDDASVVENERFLLVDDSLEALQALASLHRIKLSIPVIGITGSNGKTTTKELLNQVLTVKYKVACTKGNYNNHIGVPLTILNADREADMLIVEMGSNQPGDIAFLCGISKPDIGVITNIGLAHLELLKGVEGVYQEKTSLFESIKRTGGMIFINSDDSFLRRWMDEEVTKTVYTKDALGGSSLTSLLDDDQRLVCSIMNREGDVIAYKLNMTGMYNVSNAVAAISIGEHLGIPYEQGLTAVASYIPANQRSQLIKTERNTLIADAYNANPSSVKASIMSFNQQNELSESLVIIGDMLELGDDSILYHQEILELIYALGIEHISVGPLFAAADKGKGKNFTSVQELIESGVLAQIHGTNILIKGSRGMKLERSFEFL